MTDDKEIKGEIEAWSADVHDFKKFGRGSRGIKVEGEWQNIIGKIEDLEKLSDEFPKGTLVKFKIKQNKRGYWDVSGALEKIDKQEAYEEEKSIPAPQEHPPTSDLNRNRDQDIKLQVCFKGAVEMMKIVYRDNKGPIDMETLATNIHDWTRVLYKGLKLNKEKLIESGGW